MTAPCSSTEQQHWWTQRLAEPRLGRMGTRHQRRLALVCALALFAALQPGALAQDVAVEPPAAPPFDPNSPNAEYLFGFPFCRCNDYRCSTSPYKVVLASQTNTTLGYNRVCFRFEDKAPCAPDNECCKSVRASMGKVEFMAGELDSLRLLVGSWRSPAMGSCVVRKGH